MQRQPELEGATVRLRPLLAADHEALAQAASDPDIWAQHPEPNRYEPERFKVYFDDAIASGGALAILEKDSDRIIGSSRFHAFDPKRRQVEIGWTFLTRDHWGGTTNREIKDVMLRHAFASVETVCFLIGAENLRSRRAVEKLGARLLVNPTESREGHVTYALTQDLYVTPQVT